MLVHDILEKVHAMYPAPIAIACSPATLRRLGDELAELPPDLRYDPKHVDPELSGLPVESYDGFPDGAIRPIYTRDDRYTVMMEASLGRFRRRQAANEE